VNEENLARAVVELAAKDATAYKLALMGDRAHQKDGFMPSPWEAMGFLYFVLGPDHTITRRVRNMRLEGKHLNNQVGAFDTANRPLVYDSYRQRGGVAK
jgi:hypothetical protein